MTVGLYCSKENAQKHKENKAGFLQRMFGAKEFDKGISCVETDAVPAAGLSRWRSAVQ